MSIPYGGGYQPLRRVNFGWISEAFELFKANAGVWVVAALLALVPAILSQTLQHTSGHPPAVPTGPSGQPDYGNSGYWIAVFTGGVPLTLYSIDQIFSSVYGAYIAAGVYRTAVKQVRGEAVGVGDLFSGGPFLLSMLVFTFVYHIVIFFGLFFCILPAVLLAGLLFPCSALIADGVPLGSAVSRTVDGMKQDVWNAAGFAFVMGLLVVASFFACLLGEFVTLPMTYLVAALAYRDMIGMPGLNQSGPVYGAAVPGVWPPAPNAAPPPPQQYPGFPAQQYPPPVPPQQYPGFPPQQYAPPPPQQYPSVPPSAYPPQEPEAQEKSADEPLPNPWQSRPPTGGSEG